MPWLGGCLDIKLENQFTEISTVDMARELLAAAYNSLPRYQMELSVMSDDFMQTSYSGQYAEMQNLYNWQDNAISDLSDQVWGDYYMTVAYLNTLLTRLDEVRTEGEEATCCGSMPRGTRRKTSTGTESSSRTGWNWISSRGLRCETA